MVTIGVPTILGAVFQAPNDDEREAHFGSGEREESLNSSFDPNPDTDYLFKGHVNGDPANILVDTGAAVSILAAEHWDGIGGGGTQLECCDAINLMGVQGIPLNVHGIAEVQMELKEELFSTSVLVVDGLAQDVDAILGRVFLRKHGCTIEMSPTHNVLHFG